MDIAAEAKSWVGTPYVRRGAIKGSGCDCGSLPGMVLVNCGCIPRCAFDEVMKQIESLADDWFMHGANDIYTELLSLYCAPMGKRMTYATPPIASGSILLMQTPNSKRRNHAGIVTQWPMLVQAVHSGVEEIDASRDPMWAFKEVSVFQPRLA